MDEAMFKNSDITQSSVDFNCEIEMHYRLIKSQESIMIVLL